MQQFQFNAIGTAWQINSINALSKKLKRQVSDRTKLFDQVYSRFQADSLVKNWAAEPGEYALPKDAKAMLIFYKKLYDATGGQLTPMIGNTMEQAGYDTEYSLKPKRLTAPVKWKDAISFNDSKLIVKQPVLLDFGAAGKGYLVDIVSHMLYTNGIDRFCVNASGDLLCRDMPQTIGLEDPDNNRRILGTVEIFEGSLCSSASNRRKWDKYHHIINPQTLESPRAVKATWVKAETAMLADGIATALFFEPPETLLATFDFDYAMIEGEDLKYSNNFKANFFTK